MTINFKYLKITYGIVLLILSQQLFPQYSEIDSLIRNNSYNDIVKFTETCCSNEKDNSLKNYIYANFFLKKTKLDSCLYYLKLIDTVQLNQSMKAAYHNDLGDLYSFTNIEDKAVFHKLRAQNLYSKIGNSKMSNHINYDLHYIFSSQENLHYDGKSYLDKFYDTAKSSNDIKALVKAHMGYASFFFSPQKKDIVIYHLNKANQYNKKTKDSVILEKLYSYYGLHYTLNTKKKDSAFYNLNKSLQLAKLQNNKEAIFTASVNMATLLRFYGEYEESISWMKKAETVDIEKFKYNQKKNLYYWLSDDFKKINKKDSAYKYLSKYVEYTDSVQIEAQNLNLTLLRTSELEKVNDNLKADNEKGKIKVINISILSLLMVVILVLIIINQIRIKKLMKREKELEEQKVEKLLKEYELNSIDSMIEGQEKERKQIANDLHDSLGSILATLKLHFENFKVQKNRFKEKESQVIQKTDELIEEAYQKVRSIAHIKNAGVHAKEGLLPAVKNFATKVSSTNQLVIEVIDHGMDQRLENSLEVTIFRIIQELITNIIKHSKASESTIHLTHHENSINIMVEDNGIGFKVSNITPKEGMGLYSIRKRIENLDGSVTIDSILQNGTTVIIDIPIS